MKLKHILLTAVMALFAVSANAASADELKIYINPGHGSWGPNNRHCATIGHETISTENPDTTDFFESNTNLRKALAMYHRLIDLGFKSENRNGLDLTQNVVMSHVKCGPYPYEYIYEYNAIPDSIDPWGNPAIDTVLVQNPDSGNDFNRTLSEIANEAETWGADQFVSIHSNAASEGNTTNYLYFAYRTSGGSNAEADVRMSMAGWNHRILDRHTKWTHYDYTLTDDDYSTVLAGTKAKIGTQVLGVLNHSCNGYLVEGYFHTYQPARHRAMNFDVDNLEGLTYAWGVCDYWGVAKESKGNIYGIVRDHDTKFSHSLYNANVTTSDVYKPLNGVKVTLKQGDTEVATYTTDVNYNGAYVFKDLEPGTYTLEYSLDNYIEGSVYATTEDDETPAASLTVTVSAAAITYHEAYLRNTEWTPPTVSYVNYPDSTAGKGYTMLPKYETKTTSYDLLSTYLEGKTVRRQLLRDDKLYVLALDSDSEPYIYLADLAASTVTELDKAAVVLSDNGRLKISDIALTADHVLVASSLSKNHYSATEANADGETRGQTNFYKWTQNEETGLPETCELWFTSTFSGNYYRALTGKTIAYSGTLEEGTLITTSVNLGNTTGQIRMGIYSIAEGVLAGSPGRWNWANTDLLTPMMSDNDDFELMVSPRDEENYVFDGNATAPFEFTGSPTKLGTNSLADAKVNGANYFKYADKDFMVTPKLDADGKIAGVRLFDITDGFEKASEVTIEATIDPVEYTYASAHGELALTLSSDDRTTGATIELFLAVDGKVTKFTAGDFYTSKSIAKNSITGTANPFAYALKSTVTESTLSVSYSLNTEASDVNIYVLNEAGEEVASYAAGAQASGDYTAEISISGLENGNYTWEVEVAGAEKSTIERFSTQSFYHPSGLDVDNSFESGSFGTLFVCEGYNQGKTSGYVSAQADGSYGGGLYIFNPKGEQVLNKDGGARFYPSWMTNTDRSFAAASAKTCGADFCKVAIADDGRIFVNRYNFSGDIYLYAESLEQLVADGEFTSLVSGMTPSDGAYYDASGNYLAGPAQSFDVMGSGDDTKLIALSRTGTAVDYAQSQNRVVEYNLGTASTLPTPTAYTALDKKYTISYDRKSNIAYDNNGGVWYIQYRGTPTDSEPALVYVNADGEVKYFEGAGGKARYQGAIAVSPDGNRIVASSGSGLASVYEVIVLEDGSIYLNEEYRLTHNMGSSLYSAAWDAAGNFYLGNASNEVVQGYALPRTEAFTTKAASKYAFTIVPTGVEGINADNENAPAVYYNLQGVQVENPENGIYIVKRGNKVTKEYIRR